MEQLAIPLTTAFMCMLSIWVLWVSVAVLSNEEGKIKLKMLESRINKNDMGININRSKGSIHDSKINNLNDNMRELSLQIQREFDQTREMIKMAMTDEK